MEKVMSCLGEKHICWDRNVLLTGNEGDVEITKVAIQAMRTGANPPNHPVHLCVVRNSFVSIFTRAGGVYKKKEKKKKRKRGLVQRTG